MSRPSVTRPLDGLDDRRLAAAVEVVRFLRRIHRHGHGSWWYAAGTQGAQAAVDLAEAGLAKVRPDGNGTHVALHCGRGTR